MIKRKDWEKDWRNKYRDKIQKKMYEVHFFHKNDKAPYYLEYGFTSKRKASEFMKKHTDIETDAYAAVVRVYYSVIEEAK
jgi:hypothetical protein